LETNKHQDSTRRRFLGMAAAGGAALLTGGFSLLFRNFARADGESEPTIPQLQAMLEAGQLTSEALTGGYLNRIASLNPLLHAVIEVNPDALSIAKGLDDERKAGQVRGPLHGIPILVKDNIATFDKMQTTAGSLALVGSQVPGDATVVSQLRAAGAVILGKANLGEWANFRGIPMGDPALFPQGWSARGGDTINPYVLSYSSLGSSSGSGVGVAANLCAAAVGTETDGSVVGPSNANCIVGLKPTLGLISQQGIIPITHQQDTAGPLARTVTDLAILLGALQSPFGDVSGQSLPSNYMQFLQRGALKGARIGVDLRFFDRYADYGYPGDDDSLPLVQQALNTMAALGATLVDTDTGDILAYFNDVFPAWFFEFKAYIAEYLATLTNTDMHTLADLIAFNKAHCPEELVYYGQELWEMAEARSGDLNDPTRVAARSKALQEARSGIDNALAHDNLDAIVAPHLTNTTAPAIAGYPNLALPVGIRSSGKPVGILMYSTFLQEPKLLALAYDLEQEMQARRLPEFLGAVIPPPSANLCGAPPSSPPVPSVREHLPRGRFF
jgi:amidase